MGMGQNYATMISCATGFAMFGQLCLTHSNVSHASICFICLSPLEKNNQKHMSSSAIVSHGCTTPPPPWEALPRPLACRPKSRSPRLPASEATARHRKPALEREMSTFGLYHEQMYIYIYMYIYYYYTHYIHTYIHTYIYIYTPHIYIYIYIYVCGVVPCFSAFCWSIGVPDKVIIIYRHLVYDIRVYIIIYIYILFIYVC